jgi:hypothetical protein
MRHLSQTGETAHHPVALNGHTEIAKLLINNGCHVNISVRCKVLKFLIHLCVIYNSLE